MRIDERPLLTDIYATFDEFKPEPNSVYLFGLSVEERSQQPSAWRDGLVGVELVEIEEDPTNSYTIRIDGANAALRSEDQLRALWDGFGERVVYIDITGLSHHVWAPVLRTGLRGRSQVRVVYKEPAEYRFSENPTEGEIFDLSERIRGISPLPGFTTLVDGSGGDVAFIPFLGFEGTRLAYALEAVQPPGGKVFPVLGVPGFRPEYPFHSYLGNRSVLLESRAWHSIRFAIANCPFSAFYVLEDIAAANPGHLLKVAPIGTKPHALGAILFALTARRAVEIVYDHPIRKPTRTSGAARALVYDVSSFGDTGAPRWA